MAERIFVSYSHHDAALVTPVVRLLRSTNDFVFQDTDSIKPGSRWRGALADAIRESNLVVIFWCLHANESSEVESEYLAAIDAAKNILPVLLDSTPVPAALGEFQWVDFRQLVQHGRLESAPPAPPAPSFRPRSSWLTAAAGLAMLVVALSVWTLSGGRPVDVPGDQVGDAPAVEPAEPVPPSVVEPDVALSNYVAWMVLLVLVGLALAVVLVRRMVRTTSVLRQSPGPKSVLRTAPQFAMAESLTREISRRLRHDVKSTTDHE